MKKELREKVYKKCNERCAYCGKELKYKDMQVDHLYPKAFPGLAATYGIEDINSFENLMPSCRRCNHYKRTELIETFRRKMKTIHLRIKEDYISKIAIDYGIIELKPFDGKFYFQKLDGEKI